MSMMNNLKSGLSDMKSRTLLFVMLIAAGFLGMVVFFAYHKATQSTSSSLSAQSRVVNPAANIRSIPGVSQSGSKEYKDLQAKKTREEAAKAYQTGGSDVSPILSPGKNNQSLSQLERSEREARDRGADGLGGAGGSGNSDGIDGADSNRISRLLNNGASGSNSQSEQAKRLQDELEAQERAQQRALDAQRQRQADALARQQESLRRQKYKQDLTQQIQALRRAGFSPNSQPVSQTVVYAEKPKKSETKSKSHITPASSKPPKIIYKAGTMLQGVLLSSVNSDNQSAPIVAQVVTGPLRGARLVGSIDEKSIPKTSLAPKVSKALVLNFNVISIPQLPNSIRVKAVAINPDTASTGIATDVDNHYLLRYGTFLGASFLSGLSQAIQQSGQQIVAIPNTNNGNNQNQLAVQHPETSRGEQIEIAVGNAMQQLVNQVNYLGMPPTIKIASGTAIGLLLLDDLTEQTPSDTLVKTVGSTSTVEQRLPARSTLASRTTSSRSTGASNSRSSRSSRRSSSSTAATSNRSRAVNNEFQQQLNQLNSLIGSNN